MRYILAHLGLTAIAAVCAMGATWLVVTNTTGQVDYGVALLAMVVIGLAWFPVLVAARALTEELEYQRWREEIRRKMGRRRHPSKQVH